MAEDIYTQLGIDKSKLKRDYITDPLKRGSKIFKGEYPYKEDLVYLYITLNLTLNKLCDYFGISQKPIVKWLKHYNIKKDTNLILYNTKQCCKTKYGDIYYNNRNKCKQTTIKHFGVEYSWQSDKVKDKIKQVCLKKFGSIHPSKTKKIKDKVKKTCLKHFGVEFPSQSPIVKKKIYNTMKRNKSFNTSKEEKTILKLLKLKIPNIKYQYKSNLYPFQCDFYIPEIDTYIEYQGYWTHGGEPFVGSPNQLEKVKLWESKNTRHYKNAINVWTQRDPLKRKTAKEKSLKWLEFFNVDEFMIWYDNLN